MTMTDGFYLHTNKGVVSLNHNKVRMKWNCLVKGLYLWKDNKKHELFRFSPYFLCEPGATIDFDEELLSHLIHPKESS